MATRPSISPLLLPPRPNVSIWAGERPRPARYGWVGSSVSAKFSGRLAGATGTAVCAASGPPWARFGSSPAWGQGRFRLHRVPAAFLTPWRRSQLEMANLGKPFAGLPDRDGRPVPAFHAVHEIEHVARAARGVAVPDLSLRSAGIFGRIPGSRRIESKGFFGAS